MKPKELFEIVVKTIGLIAVLQGALCLLDGIMIITDFANVSHSTPKYWAIRGAAHFFVGLFLLRGLAALWISHSWKTRNEDFESNRRSQQRIMNGALTALRTV